MKPSLDGIRSGRRSKLRRSLACERGRRRRLPAGVRDGVRRADLCLGTAQHVEQKRDCMCAITPHPYVGRMGGLFAEGYTGLILGTYEPRSARIHIFGYVYDPGWTCAT
jgi:hypothetical protein